MNDERVEWGTGEQEGETSRAVETNVRAIAALEREALARRTLSEKVSDLITRVIGSLAFVVAHLALFVVWVLTNLRLIPRVPPFDPFPFGILTLIVSAEGVLLALFILVSQNRMIREADHRAHLNLQVSLLAEEEATQLLQLLTRISRQLGLPAAPSEELEGLAQRTNVQALAREVKEKVPGE